MKALALLLIGILVWSSSGCSRKPAPVSPVEVGAERVEPVDAAMRLVLTGEISARVESDLGFRTDGRIVERLVEVGDRVSPGQVLARLDPGEQRTKVEAAEADVRAAEAKLRSETSNLARQKFLLTHKAAWAEGPGPVDTGDNAVEDQCTLASMAFVFAAEVATQATDRALHVHGGYGFSEEYDIQLYYRRARGWSLVLDDPAAESRRLADLLFGAR